MVRDLQWGKWRYLNIIREQGGETLTMGTGVVIGG